MSEPAIDLKNRYLAAFLAWLVPGAGHFYQGRFFKAAIYFIGILGTFCYGMALGEWQVVYYRDASGQRPYGYFAQMWVGLPAMPAIWQSRRFDPTSPMVHELERPINAPFEGYIEERGERVALVRGQIHLEQGGAAGPFPVVEGTFEGTVRTLRDGVEKDQTLTLGESFEMDPAVAGSPGRFMSIGIASTNFPDRVVGTIPRRLSNWFQTPPSDESIQNLHRRLGKFYELASVFTWIAGLLNILAIWDALEGPAYGIGNEPPPTAGTGSTDVGLAPEQPVVARGATGTRPVASSGSSVP